MSDLEQLVRIETLEQIAAREGVAALLSALEQALAGTPPEARATLEGGVVVGRAALEAIRAAVLLDRAQLERHPESLFQCLWNRLYWHDAAEAAAFYDEGTPGPWTEAGPKLSALAERWRLAKEAAGAVWLRSRRPPAESLAAAGSALVLRGNEAVVDCLAVSTDGRLLAAGAGDFVCVWDLERGALWRRLDLEDMLDIRGVAISPDGRHLATGTRDHTARVWDLETEAELWAADGHEGQVTSVAFSPDGARVAAGNLGWTARVYDLTGEELTVFEGHRQSVLAVAFAPDGRSVASAGSDGTVQVWDAGTGARLAILGDPEHVAAVEAAARDTSLIGDSVQSVAFRPDGARLAACVNGAVRVWDTGDWRQVAALEPGGQPAWLADGRLAVSAWESLDVWDDLEAAAPAVREAIDPARDPQAVTAFLPDGRVARSAPEGTIRVWSPGAGGGGPQLRERELPLVALAADPLGARVIVRVGQDYHPRYHLLDVDSARLSAEPALPEDAVSGWPEPTLCPRSLRLVAADDRDDAVRWAVWDLARGARLATLETEAVQPRRSDDDHARRERQVLFHPDGRRVIASHHRRIGVWDGVGGALLGLLGWEQEGPDAERPIEELRVVGEVLLARERPEHYDGEARFGLWSLQTGRLLAEGQVGAGGLDAVAVRADERLAASARKDGKIYLWGLGLVEASGILFGKHEATALAFSPDGTALAAAGPAGDLRVWDLERRELERQLSTRAGRVRGLAWGADGLVTAASDGLRVWNPDSGEMRFQLPATEPSTALEPAWVVEQDAGCAVHLRGSPGPVAHLPERLGQARFVGGDLLVGVELSSRLPAVYALVGAGLTASRTPWSEPPEPPRLTAAAPPPGRGGGLILPPGVRREEPPPRPKGFSRF